MHAHVPPICYLVFGSRMITPIATAASLALLRAAERACHVQAVRADLGRLALQRARGGERASLDTVVPDPSTLAEFASQWGTGVEELATAIETFNGKRPPPSCFR